MKRRIPPATRRLGRPSIRPRAIEERICERIAWGEPLNAICRDKSMPAKSTVFRWLAQDAKRAAQFAMIKRAMIAEGLIDSVQKK